MSLKGRISIFLLVSLVSIWLGFFAFSEKEIHSYYMMTIYYILTFQLLIWFVSFFNVLKSIKGNIAWPEFLLDKTRAFFKENCIAVCLLMILLTIGFSICKPDYRILSDEAIILSDTKSLYESKSIFTSTATIYKDNGRQMMFNYYIDKRPLLFQYFVSFIHSLKGYDPANIFIANYIAGIATLFLFYYMVKLKYGKKRGLLSAVLLCSYPLFLLYTSSAGVELFNLFCSLLLFLLIYKFIENPVACWAEILILWVPLMAQSRYESILSLFVVLWVIYFYLPKYEYEKFSYKVLLLPIFCVPIPWLRTISDSAIWWENRNPKDIFCVRFIWDNFRHAIEFFFTENSSYGIISGVSCVAILGLIIAVYKLFTKQLKKEYIIYWFSVFIFYFLHALVRFMYVDVDFRHPSASRLALIFLPIIAFSAVYFLIQCQKAMNYKVVHYIIFVLICLLPYLYWPKLLGNNCGYNELLGYNEFKCVREVLKEYFADKRKYCVITSSPLRLIPLEYSSIDVNMYLRQKHIMDKCIKDGIFKYYVIIQRFHKGKPNFHIPDSLDSKLVIEKTLNEDFKVMFWQCDSKSFNESEKLLEKNKK